MRAVDRAEGLREGRHLLEIGALVQGEQPIAPGCRGMSVGQRLDCIVDQPGQQRSAGIDGLFAVESRQKRPKIHARYPAPILCPPCPAGRASNASGLNTDQYRSSSTLLSVRVPVSTSIGAT